MDGFSTVCNTCDVFGKRAKLSREFNTLRLLSLLFVLDVSVFALAECFSIAEKRERVISRYYVKGDIEL